MRASNSTTCPAPGRCPVSAPGTAALIGDASGVNGVQAADEQFAVGEPIADSGVILVPIPAGEFEIGGKFDPKQPHDRTMVPRTM